MCQVGSRRLGHTFCCRVSPSSGEGGRYRQQPVPLLIEVHVRCCFRHMASEAKVRVSRFSFLQREPNSVST